jgi:hypothetical protein|tara:strand:+ start:3406 stop:3858 length:453 start_codon:yes stop_codon:yes gene_type:complete
MKNQDSTKLELLMTVNDNFIVQRFFNVRDYNKNAKSSYELYRYMKDFSETLTTDLKYKTMDYLSENMYQIMNNPMILETSNTEGPEHINIYLKKDGVTMCHRIVDAKLFPPKIRYTVDVRPHLKSVLYDLTDIFSSQDLNYEYLGINLTQ